MNEYLGDGFRWSCCNYPGQSATKEPIKLLCSGLNSVMSLWKSMSCVGTVEPWCWGGCGWGGERLPPTRRKAVRSQSSPSVCWSVLGQDPEPLIVPHRNKIAANRCTVWTHGWMSNCTVKRFEWSSRLEKLYINTDHLPFEGHLCVEH